MLSLILAVTLLLIATAAAVLRKTYNVVPPHELKRQAAAGNQLAITFYRAVGHGRSLRTLLWLVLAISGSAGLALLVRATPLVISILVIAVLLWLEFSWLPSTRVTGAGVKLAQIAAPVLAWVLHYLGTPLNRIANLPAQRYLPARSGLYELQDLVDLLELQAVQTDNRITIEQLDLVRQVLRFGDYKVRDVLRPRQQIKTLAAADAIGPILLDELHASGQTSFPIKKTSRSKEIVGTLQLGAVGIHSKGLVENYMTAGVTYVHESDSLADALHVFYQTKQQLFIVINSFEEYVGVLTLEDILHVVVGRPEPNETLGSHDDSAVVAARHPRRAAPVAEDEPTPESDHPAQALADSDETMVE